MNTTTATINTAGSATGQTRAPGDLLDAYSSLSASPSPSSSASPGSSDTPALWRRQQMAQIATLAVMCAIFFSGVGALLWYLYGGADRVPQGVTLVDLPMDRGGWLNNLRRAGQPRPQPPAPVVRDGVRKSGNTSYSVRAGDTTMYASKSEKGGWVLRFGYATPKFTAPDQPALLTAKYNSRTLGLTEEQLKQLNALPAFGGMVVDDAGRAQMESLWAAYVNAADDKARADAEAKIIAALGELGARSLDPTRAAIGEHVAKIRAILTPEQIGKLTPNARR